MGVRWEERWPCMVYSPALPVLGMYSGGCRVVVCPRGAMSCSVVNPMVSSWCACAHVVHVWYAVLSQFSHCTATYFAVPRNVLCLYSHGGLGHTEQGASAAHTEQGASAAFRVRVRGMGMVMVMVMVTVIVTLQSQLRLLTRLQSQLWFGLGWRTMAGLLPSH